MTPPRNASEPQWEYEVIYHDGDLYYNDLCEAIDSANYKIDLETYILDQDPIGKKVLHHLSGAVTRGVAVRLLLDGIGCSDWTVRNLEDLIRANINARFYHPLPWQVFRFRFFSFFAPKKLFMELWKLNRRNHRKSCVIDESIGFLGGLNISARHSKKTFKKKVWRDTSVQVKGKHLAPLSAAFEHAWAHSRRFRFRFKNSWFFSMRQNLLRLNFSRKQRKAVFNELIEKIRSAKTRIWITNPYFIPSRRLSLTLRAAAQSGIEVRLLVSKYSDIWGIKWAIEGYYKSLLQAGVKIYEYKPSILHAKVMLIDHWTTVGSSNLNHRSLFQDLEVDVILKSKKSISTLENRFLADLRNSDSIELESWQKRSIVKKVLEKLALIFRKWL